MDYTTRSYHSADCDPGDCNYEVSEEYADDFVVETAEEFENSPEEFVYGSNGRTPEDEQAASLEDEYSYLDPEKIDVGDNGDVSEYYEKTQPSAYQTENAHEFTEEKDYGITGDVGSDEQVATIDEWYTTDKPSARERCELDDYEIISDVLGSEKQLVKLYSTALCEAAEEPFRNIIRDNLDSAAADQFKTFEYMQKCGMYPTEQAAENDITKAKQQFTPLCGTNCSCEPCGCSDVGSNCGGNGSSYGGNGSSCGGSKCNG